MDLTLRATNCGYIPLRAFEQRGDIPDGASRCAKRRHSGLVRFREPVSVVPFSRDVAPLGNLVVGIGLGGSKEQVLRVAASRIVAAMEYVLFCGEDYPVRQLVRESVTPYRNAAFSDRAVPSPHATFHPVMASVAPAGSIHAATKPLGECGRLRRPESVPTRFRAKTPSLGRRPVKHSATLRALTGGSFFSHSRSAGLSNVRSISHGRF